jgi:ketosteroid isomerase-like protein
MINLGLSIYCSPAQILRKMQSTIKQFFILTLLTLVTLPAFSQQATDRRAILLALKQQTNDWNAGRVDRFMSAYWPSDSLTFVSKTGVTYGYTATLANYKKRYPDRDSMGTLKFDILQMDFPAPNVAYVIGRWHLNRPKIGDKGGHFTLLWRKIKKRWIIVSDHTS